MRPASSCSLGSVTMSDVLFLMLTAAAAAAPAACPKGKTSKSASEEVCKGLVLHCKRIYARTEAKPPPVPVQVRRQQPSAAPCAHETASCSVCRLFMCTGAQRTRAALCMHPKQQLVESVCCMRNGAHGIHLISSNSLTGWHLWRHSQLQRWFD